MFATVLLGFVGLASLATIHNWRWGLFLCVLVGLIQDPIRKVTPGTPAYLLLTVFPIYGAMMVGLWNSRPALEDFFRFFARLREPLLLFAVALVVSSLQTLAYGPDTLPLIFLGVVSYIGWLPGLLLGFFYLRKFADLDRLLIVLGGCISLMLIGVVLEHAGVKFADHWLGMVATDQEWRHFYGRGQWVVMLSGFFRAPEVMAWHAATLIILSIYLMVRWPVYLPLWLAQAAWGLTGVLLSGRRKMFLMIFLFAGLFALLARGRQRGKILALVLAGSGVVGLAVHTLVEDKYLDLALTGFTSAETRVSGHTYSGPLWLAEVVGPFGFGVGTKTQGAQHLAARVTTPLVEGGLEKVMVELGLVGTGVAFFFVVVLVRQGFLTISRARKTPAESLAVAALLAFLGSNLMAFLVAFQIFGDPLIGILLGISAGLALSIVRLSAEQKPGRPRPPADDSAYGPWPVEPHAVQDF